VPPLAQRTDIDDLWKKYLSIHNLSDAYREPQEAEEQITEEQMAAIQEKAAADAKQDVAEMSPEELEQAEVAG